MKCTLPKAYCIRTLIVGYPSITIGGHHHSKPSDEVTNGRFLPEALAERIIKHLELGAVIHSRNTSAVFTFMNESRAILALLCEGEKE